jgi:phospholipid/cholesterol/gamma-HCH transport system substrate-binding protein
VIPRSRRKVAAIVSGAVLLSVAGCGEFNGVYDLPLPGGADVGEHPYTVTARFRDVLDLVPQAGVQVNNVPVGRVEQIALAPDGWTAEVTLLVNGNVELPANALANVRQSSLLGEKYIELAAPAGDSAVGELTDGALIPVERTDRSVELEEILGALSMLLNGSGVEQLNTITKEMNKAFEGNEADIKALFRNANELVTNLDAQSGNITRALDGLNRLSSTLNNQRDQIANAIDNLGPGLQVLEEQRSQLVTMLQALDNLSDVAVETTNASQEDLVANLQALLPTLEKLGEAGSDLPKALKLLFTFPFSDAAVPGIKGDYFNLYVDMDLNLTEIMKNLGRSRQSPLPDPTSGQEGGGAPPLPLPGPPDIGDLPILPEGGQEGSQQGGLPGILGVLPGGAG